MFSTNFIIFDLEFNSVKIPDTDKHINEIIEIGAVKLDSNLNEIGSFNSTVKPQFSKKLNSYVKKLTHIQEKELLNAKPFEVVISKFIDWCNIDDNTVFLTWSDTDLHVLVENYSEILKREKVDFIKKYTDLQKYIQTFIKTENNNQISLKAAADFYKIDTDNFSLHRAEDDSQVCGKILSLSFNENIFKEYIRSVDENDFYKRLMFKPYTISDLKAEGIDKNKLYFDCPICSAKVKFSGKYNPKIKAFSNIIKCDNCKKKIAVSFRFRKTFEKITVSKRTREYVKKKKRTYNSTADN